MQLEAVPCIIPYGRCLVPSSLPRATTIHNSWCLRAPKARFRTHATPKFPPQHRQFAAARAITSIMAGSSEGSQAAPIMPQSQSKLLLLPGGTHNGGTES